MGSRLHKGEEMELMEKIIGDFKEHMQTANEILNDSSILENIEKITKSVVETYNKGGKVVFFGNGGSASDAQHLSAELVGKLKIDRPMLNSMALNVNTSIITAVANDFSFEEVFSRQIEFLVDRKDVVVGISTSGNSKNVIKALITAKNKGALTVGFTGRNGGKVKDVVDILMNVPSDNTQRIQEMHITVGHIICEIVEQELFGKH
jgi:D-sedoheptulose 7-phosphate isomerase